MLLLLHAAGLLYLAFPAISGFLIVGPFLASGLFEKSRQRAAGKTATLAEMIALHPGSGRSWRASSSGILVLFWIRAADLLLRSSSASPGIRARMKR